MSKIKQWLKSWTINYGLLLIIMGYLQSQTDLLNAIFAGNSGIITSLIGLAVILLRFKTTQAVKDK